MRPQNALLLILLLVLGPAMADATSVLLIGDSITNSEVGGPPGPGYSEQLAGLLPGHDVFVAGASGTSSVIWDPSFKACESLCPDTPDLSIYERIAQEHVEDSIVSILLGTNDATGFLLEGTTPPEMYRVLIEALIDQVVADGASQVVLMTPPINPSLFSPANVLLAGYRREIFDICAMRILTVCGPDLFILLDRQRDFFGADIHPTVDGHRRIAEALADTLLLIPEPSSALLLTAGLIALSAAPRRRMFPGLRAEEE